jgi:hypothetical protein
MVHDCCDISGQVSSKKDREIRAVQLSNAGGLAAWSMGDDGALVCSDVTTCQTRASTILVPCN